MRYRATWLAHSHLYHEFEAGSDAEAGAIAASVDPRKLEGFIVDVEQLEVVPVKDLEHRGITVSREVLEFLRDMARDGAEVPENGAEFRAALQDFLERTAD